MRRVPGAGVNMSSTATEATSSLHQNGQLAVRLAPAPMRSPHHAVAPSTSPGPDHHHTSEPTVRRRPRKPAIPRHPIPSMQEAFAESLAEVTSGTLAMKPKLRVDTPHIRRDRLLDQDKSEPPPAALWRMRPGQNCHELRKLLAQISFGVYLLLKGMANSDAQVVTILQGHIDEVDDFLKVAMEDLKLATQDLNTRLDYLKLPLGNLAALEVMLEDREFRLRIVEGNLRIEHILSRTTTALVQTIQDVTEGLRATKEFTTYLAMEENGAWRVDRPPEVADIFDAMRGNAEGWLNAFANLEEKTNTLDLLISKFADMVTEMDRCAGEVSRRTRFSIKPYTLPELAGRASEDSQDSAFSSASYDVTPPLSPGIHVPQLPPRLSLRFSAMSDILSPDFLELGSGDHTPSPDTLLPALQYTPPADDPVDSSATAQMATPTSSNDDPKDALKNVLDYVADVNADFKSYMGDDANEKHMPRNNEPAEHHLLSVTSPDVDTVSITSNKTATQRDDDSVRSVVRGNSMTIPVHVDEFEDGKDDMESDGSTTGSLSSGEEMEEKEPADEEPLYILQPRTYTPQPATPLPSPRVLEPARPVAAQPIAARHVAQPVAAQSTAAPSTTAPNHHASHVAQPHSRLETLSPRLYIPPTEERSSYHPPTASPRSDSSGHHPTTRQSPAVTSPARSVLSEGTVDGESNDGNNSTTTEIPRKRTSIRDRVSLRTTPPDAIQVPPHNAPELERPVFASPRTFQNYRTFTGPDSAYGSDVDRAASITFTEALPPSTRGSGTDYSPPNFPSILPSPHSDQQYFRPVQASPHSPLQQRPHTAGQVPSRPHHLRNAPSSMGMSMLSSVTTMTQDSKGQSVVKKKRSAFGWLKKAFTLDEDERAAFDQRRQAQERNLYYEGKSPKFLDGKRVK